MLKGHLDAIVLAALEAGPAHGYAIIEAIKRRSGSIFDLPEALSTPHCTAWSRQDCWRAAGQQHLAAAGAGSIR